MMKDLIISAISNYTTDKIKTYVESINKCGFGGDKIMVVYNLPQSTIDYLKNNDWEVFSMESNGHPHMSRLIDIWRVLDHIQTQYRFIITTDVRDVVFQSNPSEYLETHLTEKKILVSSENVLYKDEPWGVKNILEGFGPLPLKRYENEQSCNVGVVAGYQNEIMDLLLLNYLVSQAGDTQHFTDQSSFNFIIHNNLVKNVIKITGLESNWALQIGTLPNPNLIGENKINIKHNKVFNGDSEFVIVHQYDRSDLTKTIYN